MFCSSDRALLWRSSVSHIAIIGTTTGHTTLRISGRVSLDIRFVAREGIVRPISAIPISAVMHLEKMSLSDYVQGDLMYARDRDLHESGLPPLSRNVVLPLADVR